MKYITRYIYIIVCAFAVIFPSCRDNQWDEHNEVSEPGAGASLLDVIKENPDYSRFYEALVITGYDHVLAGANNFTVLIPANEAWAQVDMNQKDGLNRIVAYHIAYNKNLSTGQSLYDHLLMVNTKVVRYDSNNRSFNGAKIVSADHIAGNGVIHVIDRIMEMKMNIWDYISGIENLHTAYLKSLNHQEMDEQRSVQKGVNSMGQPVYDTIWMNVNNFLKVAPLDNEAKELTYVVVRDEGFNLLYDKYRKYFICPTVTSTDSLTKFNVCQDFVFDGIVDITQHDTLTSIFGVKVPLKGAVIDDSYEASNGRVYVIDKSNILLKEKIKPVMIEGENFNRTADPDFVYTRYKLWASGSKDVMLSCGTTQTDTLHMEGSQGQDSTYTASKTFVWNSNKRANMTNFWIEYKATVNSVDYEIYYVAYDDITDHSSNPEQRLRFDQKLFISMPGKAALKKGSDISSDAIDKNYLGATQCFVSQDTAGIHKERKFRQWTLANNTNQMIKDPVSGEQATIMSVSGTGELTMWLCNTARSVSASAQGMLFLDYIKLVPKLPEE